MQEKDFGKNFIKGYERSPATISEDIEISFTKEYARPPTKRSDILGISFTKELELPNQRKGGTYESFLIYEDSERCSMKGLERSPAVIKKFRGKLHKSIRTISTLYTKRISR